MGFYEDMMKERRTLRAARLRAAARKAEAKKFWTDVIAILLGFGIGVAIIFPIMAIIFT